MADQKISALTSVVTPDNTDVLPTVQDMAGTPTTKKITWTVIKAFLKTYLDTLYQPVDADLTAIAGLSTANGDILYYNSGWNRLAKGSDTQVLTLASGLPSWATPSGGGTARRNLNIIMDVARLITRGTAPTNEANSQMIDCTITASNSQSTKALNLGNNSEMYDWYDKDPEINISCIYSAGSTTGSGKWFFGDTGGDQNPTNTITTKGMFVYVRTSSGTSTIYAVNANGTTNTNTSLSGVTLNSTMLWRVVKSSTTNIKYYYNYTLKATHTTNLPSGDFNDGDTHYFSVRNDNGDTTTRTGTFGLCDLLINSPVT